MDPVPGGARPVDDTGVGAPRSLRSGMGFAASSFGVNSIAGLLSAVLTARLYGLDVIGEYALVAAPWLLLTQVSNIGEQRALTRELAVTTPRDPRVLALFLPVLAFSLLLTIVIAVPVLALTLGGLAGPIGRPDLVVPAVVVVTAYILIENTSWNFDAVLASFLAGRELFVARLAQVVGFPVLAVAFYPLSPTIGSLTAATVLSFALAMIVRAVVAPRFVTLRLSRPVLRSGFERMPTMLAFGVRLLPSRVAGALTSQAGVWVLGTTAPIAVVGAFARARSVAVRLNDAGFRVGEMLFPTLVRHFNAGDLRGFTTVLDNSVRLTGLALLLLAAPAGGASGGLLDVFGPGFDDAAGALTLLLLAYAVSVIAMVQSQALMASGRPGTVSLLSMFRMVVAVGLMWPFARAWGGTGIALALLIGISLSWQVQGTVLRRFVLEGRTLRGDLAFVGRAAVCSAVGFGVSSALYRSLGEVVGTMVGVPAGMAAFLALAIVLGWLRPEEWRRAIAAVTDRLSRPNR